MVLRVALFLVLLFAVMFVWRALRYFAVLLFGSPGPRRERPERIEQEMVRDPVCGAWVDRRVALAARRGAEWVPVCSEKCRGLLESPASGG